MIRLLFTASSGLVSDSIRVLTGQGVTHVGIQTSLNLVLSAEWPCVVEQSLPKFMAGRYLVAAYEATPEGEKHLMLSRARAHIGDKYAATEIPGFVLARLWRRLTGRAIKNPTHDPHKEICSEFVLYLDDETGFSTEFIGLDPETTSPGDILARLQTGGPTFRGVDGSAPHK
jgi:hypothetical protein